MAATKPKELTKQQISTNNFILVMILITLLVVGISGLISKSLVGGIIKDGKIWSAKSTANKMLDTDLDNAPQLVESYKNLPSGTSTLISHALPVSKDFPGLIALLEVAASQAGVSVTSASPSLSATAAPVAGAATGTTGQTTASAQPFGMSIEVHGPYANLLKFMHNLEISARPMRVNSVQFTGTGSDLQSTLDLTTYYESKAGLPFSTETIK